MNLALQSALSSLHVQENSLVMGGRRVSDIAREHGTPLYIYEESVIDHKARSLKSLLPDDLAVHYAVKANPRAEIICAAAKHCPGFDIASGGEFTKVLQAGIDPSQVNFAGPGKTVEELSSVISQNIGTLSIESIQELRHCIRLCTELDKQVSLLVRVNPSFELSASGVKMAGGAKPFGIDSEKIPEVLHLLKSSDRVRFAGLHIFAGSQNLAADQLVQTFDKILHYAADLQDEKKMEIRKLNMGGGFGVPLYAHEQELDVAAVGRGLHELLGRFKTRLANTACNIELGRYLVAECGVYVTKILYKKQSRGEVFLVTDGGMHHHLAASGNLGQSLARRPMPLVIADKIAGTCEKVHVVGPLCTPLDTFGYVELTEAVEGDFVVVLNSGAYGLSASPVNFLSHSLPKEVIV